MQERIALLQEHILFLESRFSQDAIRCIYCREGLQLWNQDYKDEKLSLTLNFNRSHRKEGLMTMNLSLGEQRVYLASFWIGADGNGKKSLWIGSLQGSQGELQMSRDLTKHFFGYRPKNLMIYALRALARQLQLNKIYAVSNDGFQASHHISAKRRLKTSLDEFWQETQGKRTADFRSFTLPLIEQRKSLEEVNTKKRNLYRKRFELLDEIEGYIASALQPYLIAAQGDILQKKCVNH